MREPVRLIGSSVAVVLAVSVLGGAALAAPRGYERSYFTEVNAHIGYGDDSIDIDGESDQSPATSHFGISIDFDIDGYECGLRTNGLDYIDDDGDHSLDLNWSGEGDCGDTLFVQTSWYYETHRERSHEKTDGRRCKSKSQVDGTTEVGVTIRVDDEDAEPIVDRVFDSAGWYQTGTVRCHITGKPG